MLNTGIDKADALLAGTLSLAFFALLQPVGGLLSDRFGRKPSLLFFGLGFAALGVPCCAPSTARSSPSSWCSARAWCC